jgi:hypothetical protein
MKIFTFGLLVKDIANSEVVVRLINAVEWQEKLSGNFKATINTILKMKFYLATVTI